MLEVRNLSVSYGGLRALTDVSLSVAEGQFVTVVGPNGAGKSTLFKTICGIVPPAQGNIGFLGHDLLTRPAAARAHLGIAHVPEGRQVFKTLTVRENLEMGAYTKAGRARWQHTLERIHALFPILAERASQLAGTLSGGEQQMVAMGRALMARPKLLCMDEPSMGLAPIYVEQVFDIIQEINKQGTTIFMVEQNANMALSIAHRAYVLQTGQVVLSGTASDLRQNPLIREAYLGELQVAV